MNYPQEAYIFMSFGLKAEAWQIEIVDTRSDQFVYHLRKRLWSFGYVGYRDTNIQEVANQKDQYCYDLFSLQKLISAWLAASQEAVLSHLSETQDKISSLETKLFTQNREMKLSLQRLKSLSETSAPELQDLKNERF